MFDATLQALNVEVVEAEDHVQLVIVIGLVLPGPQGVIPVPAGVVRIPMSKVAAEARAQDLADAAANLPDPPKQSDIMVASSLAGVDEALKTTEQFKGR